MHKERQFQGMIGLLVVLFLAMLPAGAGAWPIPDTGQTTSYAVGDDGDYSINPPSYTKLGAGDVELPDSATIAEGWLMTRDNVTGLVWQVSQVVEGQDITSTYAQIPPLIDAYNTAQYGGHGDWRLPTNQELVSIANYGVSAPAIYTNFFPNMTSYFWSSSPNASYSDAAWYVDFYYGSVKGYGKNYSLCVRLVRSGQWLGHLLANGDDTVTDTSSGLMWQQGEAWKAMTWQEALNYANSLTLGGYEDWRLPTVKELHSLVDYGKSNPAMDKSIFPGAQSPSYWSSTTSSVSNSYAWVVEFYFGTIYGYDCYGCTGGYIDYIKKPSSNYVRCVRSGSVNGPSSSLLLSSPKQAATLAIGTTHPITWSDPQALGGQVNISLSRQGGKAGSWESIAPGIDNTGTYDWLVTGPESVNCVVKIEPVGNPEGFSSVGLFSIVPLTQFQPSATLKTPFSAYTLALTGLDPNGTAQPVPVVWGSSNPSVAQVVGDTATASKNGLATMSATYNGQVYTLPLVFLLDPQQAANYEGNLNNTIPQADPLPAHQFWQGQVLASDSDYFRLDLSQNAVVDIGLLSDSPSAEVLIEVVNSTGQVLAAATSTNGDPQTLAAALPVGASFIRLTSAGDIDENGSYFLTWQPRPAPTAIGVEIEPNDSEPQASTLAQGQPLYASMPASNPDWFRFSVTQAALVTLTMAPEAAGADFHLTIYKGSEQYPLEDVAITNGQPATVAIGLAAGDYLLKVEASGDLDPQAVYSLLWTTSTVSGHEIEPNNTLESASGLQPGLDQQGRIYSELDQDTFGFIIKSSTEDLVTVNFTPAAQTTADYLIEMLNGTGNVVVAKGSTDGAAAFIKFKPSAGAYYFRVKAGADVDQFANYTVSMAATSATVSPLVKLVSLTVTSESDTLPLAGTATLSVLGFYTDGTSLDLSTSASFSSSDPQVLSVDALGTVTGLMAGHATVTAVWQDKAGSINLTVGAPQGVAKQGHGNLLIVAGGTLSAGDSLKQATLYVSELAYQKFQARNFTDADIYFMTQTAFHDLNGDGYDDGIVDDLTPTKDEVTAAITGWAKDQASSGPLYVYLADHGANQQFQVASGFILTATMLKVALDSFQESSKRPVVVIIEACYSGSFVDQLTSTSYERLILTSVDATHPSYLSSDGVTSYSSFLFSNLYQGKSIADSLTFVQDDLTAIGLPYQKMAPQVAGSETLTGLQVGGNFVLAGLFPELGGLTASQTLDAGSSGGKLALKAQATSLTGGLKVWAVIVPPDYAPPAVSGDFVSTVDELTKVALVDDDATQMLDGLFEGTYNGFIKNGAYLVIFYAKDSDNNLVKSAPVTITVSGGEEVVTTTTTEATTTTTEVPATTTTEVQGTTSTTETSTTTTSAATTSTTTTIPGSATKVTLAVGEGWSLLSSAIGFAVAEKLGDPAQFTSVWKWTADGLGGAKNWAVYLTDPNSAAYASGKGFMTLVDIKAGEGFWVNGKAAALPVEVNGSPVTGDLDLATGWNLVGLQGTASKEPTALGEKVISVWKWTTVSGSKNWEVYLTGQDSAAYAGSKGFGLLKEINPGEGFWVNQKD